MSQFVRPVRDNTDLALQNYLYISHLGEDYQFWWLPATPTSLSDTMQSNFVPNNALGRSAPVYTYQNSGPRIVSVSLKFRRDIMDDINRHSLLNETVSRVPGEDYTDMLIKAIQAIALPQYNLNNKAVEPPLVAIRFSNEVFIKGVVTGNVTVNYELPILDNGKYAGITITFAVNETDPYDATTVFKNGSFRGAVQTLRTGMNID